MATTYSLIISYGADGKQHDREEEPRPFEVMVCIDDGNITDLWLRLHDYNDKYTAVEVKMLGVVGFVTTMATGVRVTIIVRGLGPVANYWNTAALVAGTVVGFMQQPGTRHLHADVPRAAAVPPVAASRFIPIGRYLGGSGSFVLNTCVTEIPALTDAMLKRPPTEYMIDGLLA